MQNDNLIINIMFYLFAVMAVGSALFSLFAKKIIYSLLWAISVFLCTAGLFFILGAEYNAVVQLTVYCTAIPILLAFGIMFTDYHKDVKIFLTNKPRLYVSFLAIGVCISVFIFLMKINLFSQTDWSTAIVDFNNFRVFTSITESIFLHYVFAFEFMALILLIVLAGISNHEQ